jgi:flap endonuclease-1
MGTPIGSILEKERISLDQLDGLKLGIDAFNLLYQFLSIIRGYDGSPLMDGQGRVTSHLSGLFYRTTSLVEKGIKPVFVFDGKAPELKRDTQEKRNQGRTDAHKKFEKAKKEGKDAEARKYAMQATKLTSEIIESGKELISLMGFPVVQAPSEGEAQIADMVKDGKLEGCISQDYDALLFGTPILYRNITLGGKRKVPGKNYSVDVYPEKIDVATNVKRLGITREKLVWIAMMCGTDFNLKFPKIGAKTGLKIVQGCDTFEAVIEKTQYTPDFDYAEIRDIFLKPEASKDYTLPFNPPNEEKLREFLIEEHAFSKERVDNTLNKLLSKAKDTGTQSRLGAWG